MNIKNKFIGALEDFDMIQDNDKIVVAVSGGSDSMCLLHLLKSIQKDKNLTLIVAHVNHCLRGKDSDLDEKLVEKTCSEMNLEYHLLKVDVKEKARESKKGIEEVARDIRYDFFKKIANTDKIKIATAHNLSDSVETVLFNIIRGTSQKGLIGIQPKRDNIIRPLIYVKKDEIKKYCINMEIDFRDDKSNDNTEFTRNKIRHKIVPLAKEINPNFEESVLRLIKLSLEQEKYMHSQVDMIKKDCLEGESTYNTQKLLVYDDVLIKKFIYEIMPVSIDNKKIEMVLKAIKSGQGTVDIKGNLIARVFNKNLTVRKEENIDCDMYEWNTFIKTGEIITSFGEKFIIKQLNKDEIRKTYKNEFNNLINCDTINKSTILRFRRKGDTFTRRGNNIKKSYKKLMQERNVDKSQRNKLMIVATGEKLLWIEGVGVSQEASITKDTQRAILILKQGED